MLSGFESGGGQMQVDLGARHCSQTVVDKKQSHKAGDILSDNPEETIGVLYHRIVAADVRSRMPRSNSSRPPRYVGGCEVIRSREQPLPAGIR